MKPLNLQINENKCLHYGSEKVMVCPARESWFINREHKQEVIKDKQIYYHNSMFACFNPLCYMSWKKLENWIKVGDIVNLK